MNSPSNDKIFPEPVIGLGMQLLQPPVFAVLATGSVKLSTSQPVVSIV
jgi:hypothetical protein